MSKYKVEFTFNEPFNEFEDKVIEFIKCSLWKLHIPKSNPMEFAVFEELISDIVITKEKEK